MSLLLITAFVGLYSTSLGWPGIAVFLAFAVVAIAAEILGGLVALIGLGPEFTIGTPRTGYRKVELNEADSEKIATHWRVLNRVIRHFGVRLTFFGVPVFAAAYWADIPFLSSLVQTVVVLAIAIFLVVSRSARKTLPRICRIAPHDSRYYLDEEALALAQ